MPAPREAHTTSATLAALASRGKCIEFAVTVHGMLFLASYRWHLPLPFVPGKRGEHQFLSVGPLPATKMTAEQSSFSVGSVMVPYTGTSSVFHVTSLFLTTALPMLFCPTFDRHCDPSKNFARKVFTPKQARRSRSGDVNTASGLQNDAHEISNHELLRFESLTSHRS
jgi:hypothetical protein